MPPKQTDGVCRFWQRGVGLNGFLPREGFNMPTYNKDNTDLTLPDWYKTYNKWGKRPSNRTAIRCLAPVPLD